ncbi:MAG: hypothetical protein JWN67_3269 [Actinomycetia bacterium]|nr:hypothetical protein [Actinomycetes bacterium]
MAERVSKRYMPDGWTLPLPFDFNRPFFTAGELRVQRCDACHRVQHPPMDVCHHCQSLELSSEAAAGTGTISSFSIVHHAADKRLEAILPYNVTIVVLDDHPEVHVVGNVIDARPEELAIDAAVRCTFAEVPDEQTGETLWFPQWELVRG